MSISDRIHNMIFEEEEQEHSVIPPPTVISSNQPGLPDISISNGQIYEQLVSKTSNNCPNLQKYRTMVQTLRSSIQDEYIRNKAAIAASGVTLDSITNEVKGMRQILKDEGVRVQQKLEEAQDQLVTQSENEAKALQDEINTKQVKLADLVNDISRAKNRVNQKRSDFSNAVTRRSAELDQLDKELNTLR